MAAPQTVEDLLAVEYWDGAGWVQLDAAADLGSLLRTRRFAAPPGAPVTTSKIRIVKRAGHDFGADDVLTLRRVACYAETADPEAGGRLWPHTFDTAEQQYMLAATSGSVEIFQRGERRSAVRLPFTGQALRFATRAQALDTHLIFHPAQAPYKIQRQGGHDQWDARAATFSNIPKFDYDGTNAGAVAEVQRLTFKDYVNGDIFNITFEGQTTSQIVYSGDSPTTAAAIESALKALQNVHPDHVFVGNVGPGLFDVHFLNQNSGQDVGELAPKTVSSAAGGVFAATITQGEPGGEPIVSDTRGWFATGAFYQGRLHLGGLASRPNTLLASRLGFHFDLTIKGDTSQKGISVDLDTDEVTNIRAIFPGRHLQVFTSSAEFFFPTEPIASVPAIKQSTRRGIEVGCPPFELSGATIFVTSGGNAVAEYLWNDSVQTYTADYLSKLASHLVKGIVDVGFRKSLSTIEHDLAVFVRSDGAAAAMTALRDEGITGFAPWTTNGAFVACAGEKKGDLYVIARRPRAGGAILTLERFDFSRLLDSSVVVEGVHEEVTGLEHLEGLTVAIMIDGGDAGDAVVENGRVALPWPSQRSAEVGLNFTTRGRLMPAVLEDPRGGASMRPRIGQIEFNLGPTANLKAGMAGGRLWNVPLKRRPTALLDEGPSENAFEGWTRLWAVPGFQNDAQIEFVQERPGPLKVIEIVGTVTS